MTAGKAAAFQDFRKVLELKEVDAVLDQQPRPRRPLAWNQAPPVLAHGFLIQNLRAPAEKAGEGRHVRDIVSWCGWRELAQPHVFEHALT